MKEMVAAPVVEGGEEQQMVLIRRAHTPAAGTVREVIGLRVRGGWVVVVGGEPLTVMDQEVVSWEAVVPVSAAALAGLGSADGADARAYWSGRVMASAGRGLPQEIEVERSER